MLSDIDEPFCKDNITIIALIMDYFKYYQNLGFNNPYYIADEAPFVIRKKFSDIVDVFKGELRIDPVSVIELLNKNHIFGDRTMIKGIHRTPWQAKPNGNFAQWQYTHPPCHDKKSISEEDIAIMLFEKVCDEIEVYVANKKNVGVLLSGGMDSRMVAGALDSLMKSGKLKNVNVTGLTWGNEGSRDVVYAKQIASRLGWHWKHYVVDVAALRENMIETVSHGCEYSPVHLHAIPQIRDDNDLDVILAGSYGDSVGRAEYSGRKVASLTPINKSIRNIAGLINNNVNKSAIPYIDEDIQIYHRLFHAKESYMQYEMDYELHYMRRMLNPCMELLTEKSEFYQVFTHPDVFSFMWSIDPKKRSDMVYKHMMKEFKTDLSDIPWSRTGLPYMTEDGTPDSFSKSHHSYVEIINKEMLDDLKDIIMSGNLERLGIFDMNNINLLIKLMKKYPINNLYFGEKIIWLASLSIFLEKNEIVSISKNKSFDISNRAKLFSDYFSSKTKLFILNVLKR